jgi:8-amino-7-oxononanoate synthase
MTTKSDPPADWTRSELEHRCQFGLLRRRRLLERTAPNRYLCRGRDILGFASNDYLNLSTDPRLARAAARAARRYGCGSGASPLVAGYQSPHRRLETALADWEGKEAALVFSSGYAANLAVLTALAGEDDAVFSDALNHASLIDGARLSRARIHVYRHADVNHLADLLAQHGGDARRRLIVTDTLFSMDGDLAPLRALCDVAERHDCLLILDEAHATGVLGEQGRGALEMLLVPVPLARIVQVGTLSKALGCQGGFVSGARNLIQWLVNAARPYIFSTALALPVAAAARKAVQIVREEPEPRQRLRRLADFLRKTLQEAGFDIGGSPSHIVPILIGSPGEAVGLSNRLLERGFFVPAIRPPSVPPGTSRLRISLTAGHTDEDIRQLIAALCELRSMATSR